MGAGMRYVDDFIGCVAVLVLEVGIIFLICQYLPFMLRTPDKRAQ